MNWFKKNNKAVISTSFLIPILLIAFVSISHVSGWYGLSNPLSWALYLSVAIEIAALSSLAGITVNLGRFIYVPFGIVTFIQFLGNLFYSFQYIDLKNKFFLAWVDLVSPLFEMMGIEPTDLLSHKRILALVSGGLLPLISLTFLHMLVKVSNKSVETVTPSPDPDLPPPVPMNDTELKILEKVINLKKPLSREEPKVELTKQDKEEVIEDIEKEKIQGTPTFIKAGDKIKTLKNQYDNPNRRLPEH